MMKLSKEEKFIIARLIIDEISKINPNEKIGDEQLSYLEKLLKILDKLKHKGAK